MNWTQEFTLSAMLNPPLPVGNAPMGTRMFYGIIDGKVEGDRLRGRVVTGGEWALIGPDGILRVDVRLQIETHDGAHIYIQYLGLLEMNEKVQQATTHGTGTEFTDQYFYTNPRLESGDPRYAWVNSTFFVGQGRILPGLGVEYKVWRPA